MKVQAFCSQDHHYKTGNHPEQQICSFLRYMLQTGTQLGEQHPKNRQMLQTGAQLGEQHPKNRQMLQTGAQLGEQHPKNSPPFS